MTNNHPALAIDPYYDGVPAYMTEVYDWAYVDPKWVQALDRNWVVRVLLFLNDQRLMSAYLNEIKEHYGAMASFFVSENTRTYYSVRGVLKQIKEDDPRDAWYFRVRNIGRSPRKICSCRHSTRESRPR